MQIGSGIIETWIQCHPRAMLIVSTFTNKPSPQLPQNTCRVPFLQLAKNILVKIEKDFSTKFWGKSWHFFWIALQTTKYDDRSAWPRLSLPRFHPDFHVPKNSPTLPPCGQGWARSSGQLHVTSPRENPWQIPSQWITTLQVKKGNWILRTDSLCRETDSKYGPI